MRSTAPVTHGCGSAATGERWHTKQGSCCGRWRRKAVAGSSASVSRSEPRCGRLNDAAPGQQLLDAVRAGTGIAIERRERQVRRRQRFVWIVDSRQALELAATRLRIQPFAVALLAHGEWRGDVHEHEM